MNLTIKIEKLSADAVIPTYGTEEAACFDLYASQNMYIVPGQTVIIPTDLKFELPKGYEMQIRPRSGISTKTTLRCIFGTVESDYRGPVGVMIQNSAPITAYSGPIAFNVDGTKKQTSAPERKALGFNKGLPYLTMFVAKGDRIAQAAIRPVTQAKFKVVEELSKTERGEGGFGSTGTKNKIKEETKD